MRNSILALTCSLALIAQSYADKKPCPCKNKNKNPTTGNTAQPALAPFSEVLQLMELKKPQVIIETGTWRQERAERVNTSTMIFANWAKKNQTAVYCVNKSLTGMPHVIAEGFKKHTSVNFIEGNPVEFLKNFNQPIDVLLLDGYDFDPNNPYPCQQHHLDEMIAAEPRLSPKGIVIIDKCDPEGKKAKLVIEYLLLRDWKIFHRGCEVILHR